LIGNQVFEKKLVSAALEEPMNQRFKDIFSGKVVNKRILEAMGASSEGSE